MHFHLFNSTNGLPYLNSSTITCLFHLYDPLGNHLMKITQVKSDDTYDWEQQIQGNNFSIPGQYAYVFQCNNSLIGGFYAHDFTVTQSGATNNYFNLFPLILLLVMAFVFLGATLVVDEPIFVYVSGVLFLIVGIYTMINGIGDYDIKNIVVKTISFVSLGLGVLLTIGAYIYNSYSSRSETEEEF